MKIMSRGLEAIACWYDRNCLLAESIGLVLACIAVGTILYGEAATRADESEKIRIVTGLVPPYMDERGRGREAEIITAVLAEAYRSDQIEFHVQPFTRHWSSFLSDDRYDAVTTVPGGLDIGGYPSSFYIHYQNGIGYRRAGFPDGLDDFGFAMLAGRRVVAFGGAAQILPGLGKATGEFALYLE